MSFTSKLKESLASISMFFNKEIMKNSDIPSSKAQKKLEEMLNKLNQKIKEISSDKDAVEYVQDEKFSDTASKRLAEIPAEIEALQKRVDEAVSSPTKKLIL